MSSVRATRWSLRADGEAHPPQRPLAVRGHGVPGETHDPKAGKLEIGIAGGVPRAVGRVRWKSKPSTWTARRSRSRYASTSWVPDSPSTRALKTPRVAGPAAVAGYTRNGIISRATMFATLIIGLIAGPAVSL